LRNILQNLHILGDKNCKAFNRASYTVTRSWLQSEGCCLFVFSLSDTWLEQIRIKIRYFYPPNQVYPDGKFSSMGV